MCEIYVKNDAVSPLHPPLSLCYTEYMSSLHSDIGLVRHEDMLQPFMLHQSSLRGRMVRLCPSIDTILTRHDNPAPVNRLLGELLTLAAMLSANLPEDGILTMQAKGSGPVAFLVVDAVYGGGLRGYASLTEDGAARLAALEEKNAPLTLSDLMGEGYLAITLDMGYGDPYQGIVPLEGANLSEAVAHYFTQSQQLDVMFHLSIDRRMDTDGGKHWAAGGIMLERIPTEGGKSAPMGRDEDVEDTIRGWSYNALLVDTATRDELLDPHLAPSALLYRLFNEGGVWIHEPKSISAHCRCSRQKIAGVLTSLGANALEDMAIDGNISVTCQFCNKEEVFALTEIEPGN